MRAFGMAITALGLCLTVAGCQDGSQAVMKKEDIMIASGFRFVPANTAERRAMFRQLPPHKFLKEIKGDKLIYIYPDPTICVCLYVGNSKAYSTYRKAMFDKQLADEQQQTASALNDFAWDWGPWGAGYPVGWPYTDSIYNY